MNTKHVLSKNRSDTALLELGDINTISSLTRFVLTEFSRRNIPASHGYHTIRDEINALLTFALGLDSIVGLTDFSEAGLTSRDKAECQGVLEQRLLHRVPAAYILGRCCYWGLDFIVDQRVLIPRSPIGEVLVEYDLSPWVDLSCVNSAMDMCTGSGCLGIILRKLAVNAQVDLVDFSPQALEVARSNVYLHGEEDGCKLICSDGFQQVPNKPYDLIICNPPYVPKAQSHGVSTEYGHEPDVALYSGADGLDFVRSFLSKATAYLADDGVIVLEVGFNKDNFLQAFPKIGGVWLELTHSEEGVVLLAKADLLNIENKES